ncbi:MAG: hypothetical protein U0165_10745 [Polyangiaceae bacterium]
MPIGRPVVEHTSAIDASSIGASLMRPVRENMIPVFACVARVSEETVITFFEREYTEHKRPPLDRLLDLRGHTDPAEAWESLATHHLIPLSWVDDPNRQFVDSRGRVSRTPRSLDQCIILASDVRGVCAAEELARDLADRLSTWISPSPHVITWTDVGRAPSERTSRRFTTLDKTHATLVEMKKRGDVLGNELLSRLTLELRSSVSVPVRRIVGTSWTPLPDERAYHSGVTAMQELHEATTVHRSFAQLAGDDVFSHHLFEYLAKAGRKTSSGFSLRSISDPFLPLLGVWGLGYMLHEILPESIVLAAPAFGWKLTPLS